MERVKEELAVPAAMERMMELSAVGGVDWSNKSILRSWDKCGLNSGVDCKRKSELTALFPAVVTVLVAVRLTAIEAVAVTLELIEIAVTVELAFWILL